MTIRPLHSIDEFREVLALETAIWGYAGHDDAVGVPMFVATVKRGGILLGAYDGDRLIGFVYSVVGLKDGRPMQWSHMLGVRPECRAAGVGRALKLEQRRISLGLGIDLMEWTYDPLVAINAHLNLRRLGTVVEDYAVDAYGASPSPLHEGAATDRFIAQWWMRSARVEAAVAAAAAPARASADPAFPGAGRVNTVVRRGGRLTCTGYDLARTDAELTVTIPGGFFDVLGGDRGLAHAWRMASREVFTSYFARGYRVVDFSFEGGAGDGVYLLRTGAAGA